MSHFPFDLAAARTLQGVLTYSREWELRREERLLTVLQRCHFLRLFKKVHTRNCSYKENSLFFQNSVSKMSNSIVVDIVKYLY